MYSLFLKQILCNLGIAQKASSVIYKYDKKSKKFHLILNQKKISLALLLVRIHIFLLFVSLTCGLKKLSILHVTLSIAFITMRLGIYSIFLIISEKDVFLDSVHLINKMMKYEKTILFGNQPGKTFK